MQIIKDLIPFQAQNIGSVRLRKFIGFSLILGLFQLSSFVLQVATAPNAKAASTGAVSSYVVTTTGGGGFGQSNCDTGSVLYQIATSRGAIDNSFAITNTYGNCASLNDAGSQINAFTKATTAYGSTGATPESQWCGGSGSTNVVVGARVYKTTNGYASGLELYCRQLPNTLATSQTKTGLMGITSSGNYQDVICPEGTAALGLYVYYGSIVDKFGFNCGPVINATQAAITSVSLSLTSKTYPYSSGLFVNSIVGGSGNGDFSITSIANGTATGCAYSALTISSSTSGTCTVTVTKNADTNYAATSKTETFTFNKATLTVTAPSLTVNVGDPIPTLTPTYTGFVNSENASSSAFTTGLVAPTCTTTYTSASTIDTSPTTSCSGGSSVGYTFNSYVTGRILIISGTDNAISLNGSSQYAVASGAQVIPTSTSDTFTVEAWIYPTSANANSVIVSQGTANNRFYVKRGTDQIIRFFRSGHSSESACGVAPQDAWTHVAIVVGTGLSKCYINGSLYNTYSLSSTTSIDVGFAVGQYAPSLGGASYYFTGKIDEVKIWSTDRSANISDDLKTYNPDASGVSAYFDFNEQVGTKLFNRSSAGTSFDLTTQSSPSISSISTTTTFQAYTVVTFPRSILTATGGWKSPANVNSIRYLVVGGGGGGGGGFNGGGGGAGGYRETSTSILPNTIYKIDVGVGGLGAAKKYTNTSGKSSSITRLALSTDSITASGGGKGATEQQADSGPNAQTNPDGKNESGGSGGGGDHGATSATTWGTTVSGAPGNIGGFTPVEGNKGGDGASGSGYYVGGGGGGAGSAGTNADASTTGLPGNGGAGVTTYITGTAINLAGGGAGAGRFAPSVTYVKHGTASHGGGSGACAAIPCATNTDTGTAGTANTGGGGGGGASEVGGAFGGNGGSGFIVIRYITDTPTIITQPLSDTTTAGIVETFTVTTSQPPAPLTKSVQWQFTSDTATGITGWTNVSTGTGFNSDTFTTVSLTKSMNKYRYRAIVTFSDTSTISVIETSTVAILTINESITITSDTSTITRKYGDTQTVRTIVYSGGTTSTGALGTSTSHTVTGAYGILANGKIILDTSTSTVVFKVDTGTVAGTYVETITVTDFKGATASYTQRVVVNPADTLTVQADTLTAITFGGSLSPTATVTGLKNGDTVASVAYGYVSCANGGNCAIGDIGPGGGVVFYVAGASDSQTAVTGITSGGIYLEAAPVGWGNGISVASGETTGTSYLDPVVNWCNTTGNTGATQTGIGQGGNNTRLGDIGCTSGAVQIATDLILNGKSDWYLPSENELLQMASQKNLIGLLYGLSNCYGSTCYWSSTEVGGGSYSRALQISVSANTMGNNDKLLTASNKVMMRPIRAFSPITNGIETVTAGAPTGAGSYLLRPTAITLANNVDTSNYVSVIFRSSQSVINRASQTPKISMQNAKGVYDTGTATLPLTAVSGLGTGALFYLIGAGSAASCSISGGFLRITSEGVCNVLAFKQASTNYLYDSATVAAVITFTKFVSHQQTQTQLYPNMIPINGANTLETTTLTVPAITSITYNPGGRMLVNGNFQIIQPFYTIIGSGFTGASRVIMNFNDFTPFTVESDSSITVNASFGNSSGLVFIECSDGRLGPTPFYNFVP